VAPPTPAASPPLWGTLSAIENLVPIRVRTSGCLFSIIASLLLTLLLNLALRACM